MANTTANYGWTMPDVNGSTGAWGAILNALFVAVDATVAAVSTVANAAMPKSGGVFTNRIDVKTLSVARSDAGSVSGSVAFDISAAQYFSFTVGGALTPSFTNAASGTVAQGVMLRITNGGAFTISWPASLKWVGGTPPTLTVSGVDLLGLVTDDNGATWRGVVIGKDLR